MPRKATMKGRLVATAIAALLLALPAWGEKKPPEFNTVEITRFSKQQGVELSQDFLDYFYEALFNSKRLREVFAGVIVENEVVSPSEAARTLTLRGVLLDYGKGSHAKSIFVGFGVGRRSLDAQFTLLRRMDNATLMETQIKVRSQKTLNEKFLAFKLAEELAGKVKDNTKEIHSALMEADRRYVPPAAAERAPAPDEGRSRDVVVRPVESTVPLPPPSAEASPPKAEPPAPKPPQDPGIVLVTSSLEGAEVYVDGGFVGNAPAQVKLAPGKHSVRVVMAGEEDWIRELSVLPGSELKLFARHTPKPPPPQPSAPAPDPKALSKEDILGLLTNFVPSARIAALVKEQGLKFRPTDADLNEIEDAGGDNYLLDTLRKAAAPAGR